MSAGHEPGQPERELWDVVVIGAGVGGGTAGYELARLGRRVLFVEKGRFLQRDAEAERGDLADPTPDPEARLRRGRWPHPIEGTTSFGDLEFFAPLGCGSGGSSTLYAARLERLASDDFTPRARHPGAGDSTLPDAWPISYAELEPWYERAETLYRVRGTPDPLRPPPRCALPEPPPLGARDRALVRLFEAAGLHPYQVHTGCAFLDGCDGCGGLLCVRACKSDAGTVCVVPAVERHGARILPRCEVVRIETGPVGVERVHCVRDGRELVLRAKVVVLAAGALMTPALLLRSASERWPDGLANGSGRVGRNLMLHVSDFLAIRPDASSDEGGPAKALALSDFYGDAQAKLGLLQSVGLSVSPGVVLGHLRNVVAADPRWWMKLTKPFLRIAALVGAFYFRDAVVFSSILEDLPYLDNRIVLDPKARSGMRFEYHYRDELRARSRLFKQRVRDALGRRRVVSLSGANNLNWGHACGTCRFGDDPATSVLDRDNRAHEVENLYVVDASFFPSSGGTNPSLTIAANALRVAEAIHRRLG